jgi:hypothetical protein
MEASLSRGQGFLGVSSVVLGFVFYGRMVPSGRVRTPVVEGCHGPATAPECSRDPSYSHQLSNPVTADLVAVAAQRMPHLWRQVWTARSTFSPARSAARSTFSPARSAARWVSPGLTSLSLRVVPRSGTRPRTRNGSSGRVAFGYLIEPRVTPEMTQRCAKMYTSRSGAIAMRYDANATV